MNNENEPADFDPASPSDSAADHGDMERKRTIEERMLDARNQQWQLTNSPLGGRAKPAAAPGLNVDSPIDPRDPTILLGPELQRCKCLTCSQAREVILNGARLLRPHVEGSRLHACTLCDLSGRHNGLECPECQGSRVSDWPPEGLDWPQYTELVIATQARLDYLLALAKLGKIR